MLPAQKNQTLQQRKFNQPLCDVACKKCGSRSFTYYGVSIISNIYFAGYRCNNCYNGLALEINKPEYIELSEEKIDNTSKGYNMPLLNSKLSKSIGYKV